MGCAQNAWPNKRLYSFKRKSLVGEREGDWRSWESEPTGGETRRWGQWRCASGFERWWPAARRGTPPVSAARAAPTRSPASVPPFFLPLCVIGAMGKRRNGNSERKGRGGEGKRTEKGKVNDTRVMEKARWSSLVLQWRKVRHFELSLIGLSIIFPPRWQWWRCWLVWGE